MKSLSAAVVALCSVASLAWAPHAEAGGNHSIRADLPCPYGGAGPADPNAWSATTGASPYNPGLLTPNTATQANIHFEIGFGNWVISVSGISGHQRRFHVASIPEHGQRGTT